MKSVKRSSPAMALQTMEAMTVSLIPNPSPAGGEGSFVSRGRDFHGKEKKS
jgi:hypothetical protein